MEVNHTLLSAAGSAASSAASSAQSAAPAAQGPVNVTAIVIYSALIVLVLAAGVTALVLTRKSKKRERQAEAALSRTEQPAALHTQEPHLGPMTVSIGNAHHIGTRESQQDCFALSDISNPGLLAEKGVFAVVADGMGGLTDGGKISSLAVSVMLRYFNERPFHSSADIELLNMVNEANEEISRFLGPEGLGKSGSTVVAVIVKDYKLAWLSVGDSRICLIRGGTLVQVNREHTYGLELDEQAAMGQITFEQAQNDPQRAALTSFLGMGSLHKIDRSVRPMTLTPGDRVLLMSDGVFGSLSDEEILSVMNLPPVESAAQIEQMVLGKHKEKQDNFTAVILACI